MCTTSPWCRVCERRAYVYLNLARVRVCPLREVLPHMQLWPPRQLQLCPEAQRRGRRVVKRLENNIHTDTHAHTHTHIFLGEGKPLIYLRACTAAIGKVHGCACISLMTSSISRPRRL